MGLPPSDQVSRKTSLEKWPLSWTMKEQGASHTKSGKEQILARQRADVKACGRTQPKAAQIHVRPPGRISGRGGSGLKGVKWVMIKSWKPLVKSAKGL